MHPTTAAAIAASWSLRAALTRLGRTIADEAADRAALVRVAADGLRSPSYSTGRSTGGHSDPVATTVLDTSTSSPSRWVILADGAHNTLRWLADELHLPGRTDQVGRIHDALTCMVPSTTEQVRRWLVDIDQRVRGQLQIGPDRWPVAGAPPCPACQLRQLYAQTSPPDSADWSVVCGAGCCCTGDGCTCGMPVLAAGVPHIWTAGSAPVERHRANLGS